MAAYAIDSGNKVLIHDDGSKSAVVVVVGLDNGIEMRLTAAQLTALTPPTPPTSYPWPTTQQTHLQEVRDRILSLDRGSGNVGSTTLRVALSADQLTAITPSTPPTSYPWPTTQQTHLQEVRDRILSLDRGAGNYGPSTLRTVISSDQPELKTSPPASIMRSITTTGSGNKSIVAQVAGQRIRISGLLLQAATPTRIRLLEGTTARSGWFTIVDYSDELVEPWELPANTAFQIEVDANTPNDVNGYITYRMVV